MNNAINLIQIAFFIIIYNFCTNLSNDIYLPSLPTLTDYFNTAPNIMQLTMSAWYAGVALPQLIFGPLADRFGRLPVLYGGGLCFLIASLGCALATNIEILIISRFLQGVGVCSWNVASYAILADLFQAKARVKVINKIGIVGTIAPLVGPVIGGYLLVYVGWRSNFLVIFILALFCLMGLWKRLPESNPFLNIEALYLKNIYKNYLLLIKENGFLQNLIPYCFILSAIVAYLTAAPFIIINQLQIDPRHFGYTQFVIFFAYILGAVILEKQKEGVDTRKFLQIGLWLILLASTGMLALSYFCKDSLLIFILPMTVYIFGASFCASPLLSEVMSTQISSKGSAAAFLGFGMAVSCTVSSSLVGLFYNGTIASIAKLLVLLTVVAIGFFTALKAKNAVTQTNTEIA